MGDGEVVAGPEAVMRLYDEAVRLTQGSTTPFAVERVLVGAIAIAFLSKVRDPADPDTVMLFYSAIMGDMETIRRNYLAQQAADTTQAERALADADALFERIMGARA